MAQAAWEPAHCLVTWTPLPRKRNTQDCGKPSCHGATHLVLNNTQDPILKALNTGCENQNLVRTLSSNVLMIQKSTDTSVAITWRRTETKRKKKIPIIICDSSEVLAAPWTRFFEKIIIKIIVCLCLLPKSVGKPIPSWKTKYSSISQHRKI